MKRLQATPDRASGSTALDGAGTEGTLFLRYGLEPPDLPKYYDVCNAIFTICHALDCKRGSLVTARHNELRDGVADLASRAFTPTHVRNDPSYTRVVP